MWFCIFHFVSNSLLSLLKKYAVEAVLFVLQVLLHSSKKTYWRDQCRKLICDFPMSGTSILHLFFFSPKICAIQLIASDRRVLKEQRTCWLKVCAPGLRGRMAESLDKRIRERGDNDFSKQHFH